MRRYDLEAQRFYIGLLTPEGWIAKEQRLMRPGHDGKLLFQLCRFVAETHWKGQEVEQVQITALDPRPAQRQRDLFEQVDITREVLCRVMDAINERFGEHTIAPAPLLNRSPLPSVISPAWRPKGPRQNI